MLAHGRREGHAVETSALADLARERVRSVRQLQLWLLVAIGCDLGLLAVRTARYPAFFSMPGALGYLTEPAAALAVYAAIIFALPFLAVRFPDVPATLRVGAVAGLIGGTIEVASTAVESLWALPQSVVSVVTGAAMLSLFLLFGVAGWIGSRRTRSFWLGLGAAVWSAMIAILIVVTFGFLLVNLFLPQLAHGEVSDPDYLRSGWSDVRAFAIANTFDNGFSHLLEAPVIATVVGGIGSSIGHIGARRRYTPSAPPQPATAPQRPFDQ